MPHTDTCRKRLTDEIGKSDEGERVKRARQKELEFYEQAIKYFDQVAKRKGVAMEEEGLTKGTRGHEEAFTSSGFPAQSSSSSSSSSGGTASAGRGVAGGERRGEKRAAEDPAADGREDSVGEKGESKNDEDVSMDCMSFQEYCDTGGLWMVACREPDEDIEEGEGGELSEGQAPDQCGMQVHDDRTGKPLDAEKVRAARAEELLELDRRECGRKPTCRSVGTKRAEHRLAFDGSTLTRVSACIEVDWLPRTSNRGVRSMTKKVFSQPHHL